jgi:hypothetical protein
MQPWVQAIKIIEAWRRPRIGLWYAQTEGELQRFPKRDAQVPPLIERIEREDEMGQQRTVKDRRTQRIAPQSEEPEPPRFHGFQ